MTEMSKSKRYGRARRRDIDKLPVLPPGTDLLSAGPPALVAAMRQILTASCVDEDEFERKSLQATEALGWRAAVTNLALGGLSVDCHGQRPEKDYGPTKATPRLRQAIWLDYIRGDLITLAVDPDSDALMHCVNSPRVKGIVEGKINAT